MRSKETVLRLHRFKHEAKRRQVADIETMIAEFLKKQDELDAHIRMEESRNGVSDPAHFNYSTIAKAARTRRDNLLRSVGELRDQLEAAQGALREEESELRKVELLAEKEIESRHEAVPAAGIAAQAQVR
ncbi:MAG: flagellar export protein FliJ [Pseudomonadota bacterium]|nr:flagellar export protein FliJ [Pseudomonadota bacterium]